MLAWLSDWLRQVLAVVLLASVIELLLPGNSFHRYMRLVLGLLVLLAMLTPLLAIFRGDPTALLERSMRVWEAESRQAMPSMPGLDDIQRRAEELLRQRQRQAAELTAAGLETSIRDTLARQAGIREADVEVELAADQAGELTSVTAVLVTVKPAAGADDEAEPAFAGRQDGEIAVEPVEEVEDVAVTVEPERGADAPAPRGGASGRYLAVDERLEQSVRSIIYQGWGVEPQRITVRMPAGSAGQ